LISIYDDNRAQTKTFRYQTSISQERIDKANRLHKEMIACIKNMDLNGALRAVGEHVELSRRDALSDLNKSEVLDSI
jgi:DNA-binding GntR family transcriptional regulator